MKIVRYPAGTPPRPREQDLEHDGSDEGSTDPRAGARTILTGLRVGFVATTRTRRSAVGRAGRRDAGRRRAPHQYAERHLQGAQPPSEPRVAVCVADPQDARHYVEVRGTAELSDDVDRIFIDRIAREYMGADEYPYESRDVSRTVITVHPTRISMPRVHGSPKED